MTFSSQPYPELAADSARVRAYRMVCTNMRRDNQVRGEMLSRLAPLPESIS